MYFKMIKGKIHILIIKGKNLFSYNKLKNFIFL
jgi:hypothetical protein